LKAFPILPSLNALRIHSWLHKHMLDDAGRRGVIQVTAIFTQLLAISLHPLLPEMLGQTDRRTISKLFEISTARVSSEC